MMRAVTEPQVSENKFGRSRCPSKRGARQEGAFHIVCMCVCVREGGASHVSGEEADTVLPGSLCGGAAAAGRCVRVCTLYPPWSVVGRFRDRLSGLPPPSPASLYRAYLANSTINGTRVRRVLRVGSVEPVSRAARAVLQDYCKTVLVVQTDMVVQTDTLPSAAFGV